MDLFRFTRQQWQLFRAIVSDKLNKLHAMICCSVNTVMNAVDKHVLAFFSTEVLNWMHIQNDLSMSHGADRTDLIYIQLKNLNNNPL